MSELVGTCVTGRLCFLWDKWLLLASSLGTLFSTRLSLHSVLLPPPTLPPPPTRYILLGDYEAAVTLLLATSFDSPSFHSDALQAIALASSVSPAMRHLAAKVGERG